MKIIHYKNPAKEELLRTFNEQLLMLWLEQQKQECCIKKKEIKPAVKSRQQSPGENSNSKGSKVISLKEFLDRKKQAIWFPDILH